MMKRLAIPAVLFASASLALAAGMDGLYGNTLVIKDKAGKELSRTTFNQDGTYSTKRGDKSVKGKWRADGDAVCTTEDGQDDETCIDLKLSGKAAGQSWAVTDGGMDLRLSVEQGG